MRPVMKKRKRLIWLGLSILAAAVAFVCWSRHRLSELLKTMPVEGAAEVLIGALSPQVLAPDLVGNANSSAPLIDQYRENPAAARQRYLLVTTWVHAREMFNVLGKSSFSAMTMVNSTLLSSVPPEDRLDGWGNPYCVLSDREWIAFLSSGGNGSLSCEQLLVTAKQAGTQNRDDSRLHKKGDLLVVVYKRERKGPAGSAPLQGAS